jgi:hypothetical protein
MLAQTAKFFKRTVLRSGSPYFYGRKYAEIAVSPRDFLERRSLAVAAERAASQSDRDIIEAVHQKGFHVLAQPFDMTDELIEFCQSRLAEFQSDPKYRAGDAAGRKLFWASLLQSSDFQDPNGILLRYASQPRIFRLASMYLRQAPHLKSVELFYSFSSPLGPLHSQLWHRDGLDKRIFKLFVYCSDVTDEYDGAFHVAPRDTIRAPYNNFPFSSRNYTDEQFARIAHSDQVMAIAGKSGTTFICDTCQAYHYGSRCVRPRLACFISYAPYASLYAMPPAATPPLGASQVLRVLLSRRMH